MFDQAAVCYNKNTIYKYIFFFMIIKNFYSVVQVFTFHEQYILFIGNLLL